jgi:hypothetical protein
MRPASSSSPTGGARRMSCSIAAAATSTSSESSPHVPGASADRGSMLFKSEHSSVAKPCICACDMPRSDSCVANTYSASAVRRPAHVTRACATPAPGCRQSRYDGLAPPRAASGFRGPVNIVRAKCGGKPPAPARTHVMERDSPFITKGIISRGPSSRDSTKRRNSRTRIGERSAEKC